MSVEHTAVVDVNTMQSKTTTITFVPNTSKSEKAPKFTGLIALDGSAAGLALAVPVFIKDQIPSGAIPTSYGSEVLRVNMLAEEFNGRTFYAPDTDGQAKIDRLSAAVRVAFYAWQKSGKPQPFSLA